MTATNSGRRRGLVLATDVHFYCIPLSMSPLLVVSRLVPERIFAILARLVDQLMNAEVMLGKILLLICQGG
jgi:hypothetical protein